MKEMIINTIQKLYGIDGNEIFSKSRKRQLVQIRQMLFYFLRENRKWTFYKIGELFGLNHATIMFGVRNFFERMSIYKDDKLTYLKFEKLIENQGPLDKELLSDFLKDNDKYLSVELKEYLNVRL